MSRLSSRIRAGRVACAAFAVVVGFASAARGAGELPASLAPSYEGVPYERLAIPAAGYRRNGAPREGRATSALSAGQPRYAAVALAPVRGASSGTTFVPVGMNRAGRILLDAYALGPNGGILPSAAFIVDPSGANSMLRDGCPACDPTPRSRSAFGAFALNDSGDVAGSWNDSLAGAPAGASPSVAYDLTYFARWTQRGSAAFSVAKIGFGTRDAAYAINNAGVAAGRDGTYAARFSTNGYAIDLGTLSGTHCDARATAINDAGTIAGFACTGDASVAVTFPRSGPARPLPGAAAPSAAEAINASGTIAGFAGASAVVWTTGRMTALPQPAGVVQARAVAYALDDAGDVVGDVYYSDHGTQTVGAFLFARGRTYLLDALLPQNSGWRIVHVTGMDGSGDIAGVGIYRDSALLPLVLKPLQR